MRATEFNQDKFCKDLKFYLFQDLRYRGKFRNQRYYNMPKLVLGFKTPNEVEFETLNGLLETTGEIRCPKRLTSSES